MSKRVPGDVRKAVDKTLEALDQTDCDAALIALLYTYADMMDEAGDKEYVLEKCGTGFLSALKQMGATPAARAAIGKANGPGVGQKAPISGLTLLMQDRAKSTGA